MVKVKLLVLFFLVLVLIAPVLVSANSHLPPGILKAIEDNKYQASDFLRNVSFGVAFLAGVLSLLSPCILPLLPAFFSYTFKEKRRITLMTSIFFVGFFLAFLMLGFLAVIVGTGSIIVFQKNLSLLIMFTGILLIILGVMSFFGKGFSGFIFRRKPRNDVLGIFVFGVIFALGWTACTGPILSGLLIMVAVFGNYLTAAYLIFFYSLGVFVPLFIFSFFYDKYNLANSKFIKGKEIILNILNKDLRLHTTNIIAGTLFILAGLVFLIYKNTAIINGFDMFGLKIYFYEWQRYLLGNSGLFTIIGVVTLLGFLFFVYKFLRKGMEDEAI